LFRENRYSAGVEDWEEEGGSGTVAVVAKRKKTP
jgi:hypothetical protein